MDDGLANIAFDNYKRLNQNQRRAFNVRINGEEHSATSRNGSAQIYFPMDGQLMQVSELAFKIIINDGWTNGGGQPGGGGCDNWKYGVNLYPTYQSWIGRYPIGSQIDVDCAYSCQCYDYASAFWRGQVNRNLETGNGYAWGTWGLRRAANLEGGFIPVYKWEEIKKGDWVVWGGDPALPGHIAMATSCATSSTSDVNFLEQNASGSAAGGPLAAGTHGPNFAGYHFLGAFRYTKWSVPAC